MYLTRWRVTNTLLNQVQYIMCSLCVFTEFQLSIGLIFDHRVVLPYRNSIIDEKISLWFSYNSEMLRCIARIFVVYREI